MPTPATSSRSRTRTTSDLAGRVLDVDDVAALTVDAVINNRLYVLPHDESRQAIRRRFERIDRIFEQQPDEI